MTVDRLRSAVRAQPFRPFIIRTADGRGYPVNHPDFIALNPQAARTFVVYDASSPDPEEFVVLDLLLVTSIDFLSGEGRNGRGSSNGASPGS
jgi:hypothetical protein